MLAGLFTLALAATSALGAIHTVIVGQNMTKTFTPSEVTAEIGDIIEFVFVAGNHTATQSTFANPCTNAGGFKSGFVPGNAVTPPSFSVIVYDNTKPAWVYCGQKGHCAAGMVMAINAPATGNTFAAFQAAAIATGNTTDASSPAPVPISATYSAGATAWSSGTPAPTTASPSGSGAASPASSGASAATSAAKSAGALSAVVPGLIGTLAVLAAAYGVLL